MEGLNLSIFVDGVILDSELETDYLCPQDSVQITIQANWQLESTSWLSSLNLSCMNCFTTVLLPKDDFWLHVEATDIFGCSEEVYTTVSVNKGCYVLIPDSFTPNGDGVGDFFFISADQKEYRLLNFRIFSHKGELIYEGVNNCNLPGFPEC